MNAQSLSDIFAMSGYAVYVWPVFVVTLLTLWLLYIFSRRRLKKALKESQQLAERK